MFSRCALVSGTPQPSLQGRAKLASRLFYLFVSCIQGTWTAAESPCSDEHELNACLDVSKIPKQGRAVAHEEEIRGISPGHL